MQTFVCLIWKNETDKQTTLLILGAHLSGQVYYWEQIVLQDQSNLIAFLPVTGALLELLPCSY